MLGEKEQKERKHENYVLYKIKSEGQKKIETKPPNKSPYINNMMSSSRKYLKLKPPRPSK